MKELDGKTPDLAVENIKMLQQIFPDVFEEGKIDFDKLKQVLGEYVDDEKERYNFTWNGKGKHLRLAQTPSTGTLRPCIEESKNWEDTQNLYIEGDNLEVLKLLQKSYHGKIKMIYIDPPYNTGKDFVYSDDLIDNMANYKKITGQTDDKGRNISVNTESDGQFHTKWLNMMFPRIRLARNLLSNNGVIFISINDKEQCNAKKICDEVFGTSNFVAQFIWNPDGHSDNQYDIKINHEYILMYAKDIDLFSAGYVVDPNTREESNLWKGYAENSITKNGPANPASEIVLPIGFPCKLETGKIPNNMQCAGFFETVKKQKFISRTITEQYNVVYPVRYTDINVEDHKTINECSVFSGWANANKLKEFIASGCNPIEDETGDKCSFYLSERGVVYYYKERAAARNIVSVLRNMGTTEAMRSELERDKVYFSYPKPMELIAYLIKVAAVGNDEIVMDFFSGSASTAHAVMQVNSQDNADRKFIMVQLPEPCGEGTEATKAGFKNICEIGKKRIFFSGEKIKDEITSENAQLKIDEAPKKVPDIGFKVFKLDSSNLKKWNPDYENLEMSMEDLITNYVDGRSELDVVYEIMLKMGMELTWPLEKHTVNGKNIYEIGMGALMICLDDHITTEVAEKMVALHEELSPETWCAVFKDNGFESDSAKVNIKEILKSAGLEEDAFTTV